MNQPTTSTRWGEMTLSQRADYLTWYMGLLNNHIKNLSNQIDYKRRLNLPPPQDMISERSKITVEYLVSQNKRDALLNRVATEKSIAIRPVPETYYQRRCWGC